MQLRNKKIYKSDFVELGFLTKCEINRHGRWITYGLHFGYPMCCITNFVKGAKRPEWNDSRKYRKHIKDIDGSGYIPCHACYCKLVSGVSIHKLLDNRKSLKLFPKG
jgi:hypothetical protein